MKRKHQECICDTPDSCFTCIYAHISPYFPGDMWQPPEPAEAECGYDEQDWDWYDRMWSRLDGDEEEMARHCNHFKRKNCYCEPPFDLYEERKLNPDF